MTWGLYPEPRWANMEPTPSDTQTIDCAGCGKPCEAWPAGGGYGHNGAPVVNGRVCNDCNGDVIQARFAMLHLGVFGQDSVLRQARAAMASRGVGA